MSDVLIAPIDINQIELEDGKLAHIVMEGIHTPEGEFISPSDLGFPGGSIVESRVMGIPLKALCGYEFVVTEIDPKRPVCQACVEIAKQMGWS